jgi:DNA-directed RNA polymerase specialized sigma24 family protein
VVSRLSLDHLRSARVRRETYVGEWLPEPFVASADDDPARKAEMADSLSIAFLVLLESLSPEQLVGLLAYPTAPPRLGRLQSRSSSSVRRRWMR